MNTMHFHLASLYLPAAPFEPLPAEKKFPDNVGSNALQSFVDWIAPAFLIALASLVGGSVSAGLSSNGPSVGLQIERRLSSEAGVLVQARQVQYAIPIRWSGVVRFAELWNLAQGD